MTSKQPPHIRPAERFLARVIVVLFVGGIGAAVLPVVADPVRVAVKSLTSEPTPEEAEPPPAAAGVVVPEAATAQPGSSSPSPPPPEGQPPAEVEAAVAEAPPGTDPPPTVQPTTTSSSTTTTTTAVPGSIPPAEGTYPYRLRLVDDEETLEAKGRLVVQAARQAEGETRQSHVYTDEVYGTQNQAHAWRGDGVFLRLIDDGSGAEDNSCDFEPDILLYPLPLTVGHAWEADSACADDPDGDRATTFSKVERADRISVGGQKVDVFVIRRTRESTDADGSFSVTETVYFAPSVGVDVRMEADYRVSETGGSPTEWREEYELETLTPE
jgi:hypothetical protein